MTTIKELSNIGIRDLSLLCDKYNMGVSVGNDGTIKGLYTVRQ